MIVVPPLPMVPADFAARLAASGAQVVLGPRTGSKTENLSIPGTLPPGRAPAQDHADSRMARESMRPNVTEKVGRPRRGHVTGVTLSKRAMGVDIEATFADGHPAIVRHGAVRYLASLFDDALTQAIFLRFGKGGGAGS